MSVNWSKHAPRRPCFALFRGDRRVTDRLHEKLNEPLQVCSMMRKGTEELAVKMTGRQQAFPLANFVGEWQVLDLDGLKEVENGNA